MSLSLSVDVDVSNAIAIVNSLKQLPQVDFRLKTKQMQLKWGIREKALGNSIEKYEMSNANENSEYLAKQMNSQRKTIFSKYKIKIKAIKKAFRITEYFSFSVRA